MKHFWRLRDPRSALRRNGMATTAWIGVREEQYDYMADTRDAYPELESQLDYLGEGTVYRVAGVIQSILQGYERGKS